MFDVRSLQKKLLIYIVIIGVIPVMLFSFFYYDMASERVTQELHSESYSVLKQLDNMLVVKISRLQNTVDIILDDVDFFAELRNTNDSDIQGALNGIYNKFARSERSLKSIILFSVDSNAYISGEPLAEKDPVRYIMPYSSVGENSGVLSWLGFKDTYTDINGDVIVAGTMLRDSCYKKDQVYVGTIYMVFDNRLFMGDAELSQVNEYAEENYNTLNSAVSIYDSNSKLIYSRGEKKLRNIFLERPISEDSDGYGADTGGFQIKIDKKDYYVIYYTSPITGWKLVRPVECEKYYAELAYIRYAVFLSILLIFLIWYVCNYFLVKKIMLPISELMIAMKSVEKDNFETELKVRSKDEFGVIIGGFNAMVAHIRTLLRRIRFEEEKRRQSDILMLRYQMNPHFLYNTLAAIRLTAIMSKQTKIAEMLLILGRFLRNAILTVNSTLDVKSEIDNINDYISLYQLRYNDRLKVDIYVDEACYDYQVLSMLCQPIIENSIMHGVDEKLNNNETAQIEIRITEEDEFLCISIYDNGKGIDEEKRMCLLTEENDNDIAVKNRLHIGILNTHRRIKMIFGEKYGLEIKSKVNEYTDVKIKLPKIKNDLRGDSKQ